LAHIHYVPDEQAGPALAGMYEKYSDSRGGVDNVLRIHSLNPPSMGHHAQLYAHLMRGASPLTRVQREIIAVVVSAENNCFY